MTCRERIGKMSTKYRYYFIYLNIIKIFNTCPTSIEGVSVSRKYWRSIGILMREGSQVSAHRRLARLLHSPGCNGSFCLCACFCRYALDSCSDEFVDLFSTFNTGMLPPRTNSHRNIASTRGACLHLSLARGCSPPAMPSPESSAGRQIG